MLQSRDSAIACCSGAVAGAANKACVARIRPARRRMHFWTRAAPREVVSARFRPAATGLLQRCYRRATPERQTSDRRAADERQHCSRAYEGPMYCIVSPAGPLYHARPPSRRKRSYHQQARPRHVRLLRQATTEGCHELSPRPHLSNAAHDTLLHPLELGRHDMHGRIHRKLH